MSKISCKNSDQPLKTLLPAEEKTWLYLWISTQDQANILQNLRIFLVSEQNNRKETHKGSRFTKMANKHKTKRIFENLF